jgi:hypothetical protein
MIFECACGSKNVEMECKNGHILAEQIQIVIRLVNRVGMSAICQERNNGRDRRAPLLLANFTAVFLHLAHYL